MLPTTLTKEDLILINELGKRRYTRNTLQSNATIAEHTRLKEILCKMKILAQYFQDKYDTDYGPFKIGAPTGNPIAIGGTTLKNIWSGLFKGNTNKQYAAQIMFHLNRDKLCLDVGFAFGDASSHSLDSEERSKLERTLKDLGKELHSSIANDPLMRERYNSLFDLGFGAYCNSKKVLSDDWLQTIKSSPRSAGIVINLYPNHNDLIEISEIDLNVSLVIDLMSAFNKQTNGNKKGHRKPLTPEQYAKQAERRAKIGIDGELYVMEYERKRLLKLNIHKKGYPEHVALISNSYCYDVLSLDDKAEEIFIEVKTTTRSKIDPKSKEFNISTAEYSKYEHNKDKFKVYRVYNIEDTPELEEIDLRKVQKEPDGYLIKY